MKYIGQGVVYLLIAAVGSIINGFVTTKLWLWFIVPTFAMNPLRLIEAIGISLFLGFIFKRFDDNEKNIDFWLTMSKQIIFLLFMSIMMLAFGWVYQLFM